MSSYDINEISEELIKNLRKAVSKAAAEEFAQQRERESKIAAAADEIIKNTSLDQEERKIFVKATDPIWDRPVKDGRARRGGFRPANGREIEVPLIQKFVANIRDAVGDLDKIQALASDIAASDGLTDDSRKFLLDLLARVKLVPLNDSVKDLGQKQFDDSMREWKELSNRGKLTAKRLKDIKATDAAVKKEEADFAAQEARFTAQMQDLNQKLDELNKRRAEFLNKAKLYNPETGELQLINLSDINIQNEDGGELHFFGGVSAKEEDGTISLKIDNTNPDNKRFKVKGPLSPDYPKTNGKLNSGLDPVEALVRAGFTKEQAERKVQEGKDKKSWKKIPLLVETEVEGEVKIPELKTQPVELPKEPPLKRDLKYYDERDWLKRDKAQRALENDGWIRRSETGKKRTVKTLREVEGQFIDAIEKFEKKYGISVSTVESESDDFRGIPGHTTARIARAGRRFKHLAGLIPRQDITDTEIMAAATISDDIEIPNWAKLSDMWIACPKPKDDRSPSDKVKKPKETAKVVDKPSEEKKVERKPRITFITKVKNSIAERLISASLKLANKLYASTETQSEEELKKAVADAHGIKEGFIKFGGESKQV